MYKKEKTKSGRPPNTYYSEIFKIKVVKEVEAGILNKEQARRKYGIKGNSAVSNWCRKYGKNQQLGIKKKAIHKKEKDESEELKRLLAEKVELESQLEASKLKIASLEALIEVADEIYSTDLKKKLGLKGRKK